jgi:hypothetical protein
MKLSEVIKQCVKSRSPRPFISWFIEHFLAHAIVFPIFALIGITFGYIVKTYENILPESVLHLLKFLLYAEAHPFRIILGALLAGITIAFLIRTLSTLPNLRKLISNVGIFAFWSNIDKEEAEKDSPLYECVESFRGEVRILLFNPESALIEEAAKNIGMTTAVYKDEVNSSIEYCKKLNTRNGGKIFLKLYDEMPLWKIVIVDNFLRVQNYKHRLNNNSHLLDIEQSPAYGFYADNNGVSIYYPFFETFLDVWNKSTLVEF